MIIGRKKEQQWIAQFLGSGHSEFLAIYGRRRIGKTYLIREHCSHKSHYMEVMGKKDGDLSSQLYVFTQSFQRFFGEDSVDGLFQSWMDAFSKLTEQLESLQATPKKPFVLFLDELPWMAGQKSGLLQAMDHYWNAHWSQMRHFKLIVCGSAASWILEHLINAKGGLHNRLTGSLLLKPFTLAESDAYLKAKGIQYSEQRLLDLYLVTGGVPHYLNQVKKSLSLVQNINEICFAPNGLLYDEFPRLFRALFKAAEENLRIVRLIAGNRFGVSREDLLKKLGLTSGGTLTKRIQELEAAGFIKSFIPYGKNNRSQYYRVIDEYSFFYLKWIEPERQKGMSFSEGYWQSLCKTPSWQSWAGYAFESICFKHIEVIRNALGLGSVGCKTGSWRYVGQKADEKGAQIDLLYDRLDDAITLCEIKYTRQPFKVDKKYAKELVYKQMCFEAQTKTSKETFMAMVSVSGVKHTIWSEDLITHVVTLKDLLSNAA